MTREEAIAILPDKHDGCKAFYDLAAYPEDAYPGTKEYMEALQMALAALCGPTREQVEKVWKGEWINKHSAYDHKIFTCAQCGKQISIQGENLDFCPKCGSTQTDKAVDILLKRLEALKDGTKSDRQG